MPGIDYSKWDNLSISDDSSAEDFSNDDAISSFASSSLRQQTSAPPTSGDYSKAEIDLIKRGVSYAKDEESEEGWLLVGPNKDIRIHPTDPGVIMYSKIIFTEDPNTYVPDRSEYENERVKKWGIEPPSAAQGDDNDMEFFMNKLMFQSNSSLLTYHKHKLEDPELQFINVLIERKSAYHNSEEVAAAMKSTYVVKIELRGSEKDVWRRVRVPSGIALSVFHDQVVCPAMGWSRGYHGYAFEDPRDGTVIGPSKNSAYIDTMHVPMWYKKVMDDKGCPLAALLSSKGDVAYYNYDLGDNWEHRLTLEDILAEEDDVTLMAGAGACPPEDSNGLDGKGCNAYADFLKAYKRNPKKQKMKEAVKEASGSINYSRPWTGGPPIPFKPFEFNIEYHRMLMEAMIAGPSVKTRKGNFAMMPGEDKYKESMKGCAKCGNRLKALSKCAGCRTVSYCSRECQVQHWKDHKVQCKKVSSKKKSKK